MLVGVSEKHQGVCHLIASANSDPRATGGSGKMEVEGFGVGWDVEGENKIVAAIGREYEG